MSLPVSQEFLKAKSNDFKMGEFAKYTSSDPVEIITLMANEELEKRTGLRFRRPSISTVDLQRQRAKGGMKTVSMHWEVSDVLTAYALGVDLTQWSGSFDVLPKDQVQKRMADAKAEAEKALKLRQEIKDGKLPDEEWKKYVESLQPKGMNYKIAKLHKLAAGFKTLAKILSK